MIVNYKPKTSEWDIKSYKLLVFVNEMCSENISENEKYLILET